MSTWLHRTEQGFEKFGHLIYRRRWLAIAAMLLFAAGFLSQLPKATIDTSTEGFLQADDPILLTYNAFRGQFGRDELMLIAVTRPEGVFEPAFLDKLRDFHRELESGLPHIDDITSPVNARNTRGAEGELIVEEVLGSWRETPEQLAVIKQRALENPVYRNMLLSEDATITTVVVKTNAYSDEGTGDALAGFDEPATDAKPVQRRFLSDAENSAVVRKAAEIAAHYQGADFHIQMAGAPVFNDVLKTAMQENIRRFMGMAMLIIGALLFLMFRRVSGVVLPLGVVVLSLLSTVGLMAATGTAIKLPTQILPSFLLAVGVGATVHLLAIFYRHYQKVHDKEEAIAYTLGHSGLAIVMTSLTTAAGLASFAGTPVAPISDLGYFASAGVLIALVFSLILLPALLAVMPLKSISTAGAATRHARMDRFLLAVADFAVNRYRLILAVSAAIFVFGLAGVMQVRFSHMPLHWLQKNEPLRQATSYIDEKMKGSSTVEVIVKTGRENGLYEPAILNGLEQMRTEMEAIRQGELFVGKTTSVADILKETNRALNENRPEAYTLPQKRDLIAQEFLLFENSGSDDLEDFVDSGFTQARFTAKTPWLDSLVYPPFIRTIEEKARAIFGDNADITITGTAALFGRTFAASIESTARSYLWAFAIITVMMITLMGNLRMGLVSMIPNLLPIFLTIGLMGWLGIPLDMFTMLVGSTAIGLAVNATILFKHNYRRYHHSSGDVRHAVEQTLLRAGRAMLVTSIVLSTGFFIYMFSNLSNLFAFGLLTGFTIITALVADFLLTPALMAAMSSRMVSAEEDHRYEDAEDESNAA